MATVVGYATLPIIPSLQGISPRIGASLRIPLADAGKAAGKAAGDGIASGVEESKAKVEKATAAVAAARNKEADAAGKVRVAEAQLQTLRDKGVSDAGRLATAEERLAAAKRNLQAAASKTETAQLSLTRAQKMAGDGADDAGRKLTGAARAGEVAGSAVGKAAGGFFRLGDAAVGAVGKVLKFSGIAGAVTGAVGGLASGFSVLTLGFNRLQSIEQAEAKLVGLGHSAESVTGIMDSALASVKGTAFGLGDAATVAASAVAAGIKPGEDLTRTLKLIGDAAVIGGSSMGEMGAIFNKVATTGKVQGEVLAQLGDRGIPIIQLLADEMGVAASEVADLGSEGKINFDQFRNAIEKGMGGAALAAGQTFSGAVDNAKAAMGRLGAEILEGPFNAAPRVIGVATSGIDALTSKVKGVMTLLQTGDFTSDIAKLLGVSEDSEVVGHILAVRDAVTKLHEGAKLLLTGSVTGGVIAAFGADSPMVGNILKLRGIFEGWGEQVRNIFDSLKDTVLALGPPLGDIIASLGKATGAVGISTWSILLTVLEQLAPIVGGILVEGLSMIAGIMESNQAIVTGLVAAWTSYRIVMMAATAAQIAMNVAMNANPIGLIVIALAALAAGVVYAYKNSETFRNIVQGAWEGIKKAVSVAWGVIKPVVDAFVVAGKAIGDAALWLWNNAIKPAWDGIQSAISIAWAVIQGIFTALKVAFALVATSALLMWENGVKPAIDYMTAGIKWGWENVIRPVWDALKVALAAVGDAFVWVWANVIKPAWDALGTGIEWVWDNIVEPVWEALKDGLSLVGKAFQFVWDKIIRPAWDALGAGIKLVWDNVITPVFDAIKTGVDLVGKAFDAAKNFIGQVWDQVRGIVARPIAFVIDAVYNRGIREAWNKVAGWLNLSPLEEYKPEWLAQYMATGGVVRGPGGPTDDRVPAMLSNGEYVLQASAVRQIGIDNLNRLNTDPVKARGKVLGEGMFVGLKDGGSVDDALARASRFMQGESGKPYQYGGVGDPSWDCSGLWSGIVNVLRGGTGREGRLFSTESDFESMGWRQGLAGRVAIGIMRGGGGPNSHMAGTLAGVNAESSGDHGVQYGGAARGADNSMFGLHYFLPEMGGEFASGGAGGGIGGRIVNFLRNRVADVFDAIMNPIGAAIPSFGDSVVGRLPRTVFDFMRDKVRDFITGKADEQDRRVGGGSFGVTPGSGPVVDQVREAMAPYGWDQGAQWDAVDWIIQRESGWNPNAVNPSSGAFGLPQFLGSTKDQYLPDSSPNPRVQGDAMARYIRDRYGDPLRAKAFWEANNWYDQGGIASGSGIMLKDVIKPERVLSPELTEIFDRLVTVLERPGVAESLGQATAPGGGAATTAPASTTSSSGVATADEAAPAEVDVQGRARKAGEDFITANVDQFKSDVGYSGSGAIPRLFEEGVKYAANFTINASNPDEWLRKLKLDQRTAARAFAGR